MWRHCDGTDPNLIRKVYPDVTDLPTYRVAYEPCACGLMFDDVQRSTVWPHDRIVGNSWPVGNSWHL
jgi:hypothetical protein